MQKPKDTLIKMHVPTLCDWFSSSLLLATPIACEQALLFGQAKRASRERSSEGASAPRGFAARSRVLARLTSLAQIGELARRLIFLLFVYSMSYVNLDFQLLM